MTLHIFTTAYGSSRALDAGLTALRSTIDFEALDVHHYLLDQHYPLMRGDVRAVLDIHTALQAPRVTLVDAGRNLGLHGGLNHLMARFGHLFADDDVLIGYDADEVPQHAGWALAMCEVFASDRKMGWLSLTRGEITDELDQRAVPMETIGGHRVQCPPWPLMNCVVGWRVACMRAMGLFTEPHEWFGGLEAAMHPICLAKGYRVGFLRDFKTGTDRTLEDPVYREYKCRHVGFTQPIFNGSFDEFLRTK